MDNSFECLLGKFMFEGAFSHAKTLGAGYINETHMLCYKHGETVNKYTLQRINANIFKDPAKLMDNIESITAHIRKKVIAAGGDERREGLNLVKTKDNKTFYTDENGDCYRAYIFIEAFQYDVIKNPDDAYKTGKAFGKFLKMLDDFPADTLHETIPNFHNTKKRYTDLLETIRLDRVGRSAHVQKEIDFLASMEKEIGSLFNLQKKGKLPIRVTHNDTKLSNVLFCKDTLQDICVIDLDTVMPGLSLYDFGDSIRSGTCTAAEDEQDLSKMGINLKLFEAYTKGYLEYTNEILWDAEKENLAFSSKILAIELAIRFLTDYLDDDKYFKTSYDHHNLDRCRSQIKLAQDMESKMDEMNKIVKKYTNVKGKV